MKHESQSENFEQLLNQALSSYAPPEPRPGLEQRILAHMQAYAAANSDLPVRRGFHWRWIGFGVAGATAAAIIVLIMVPSNCVSCSDANKIVRHGPARFSTLTAPVQARLAPLARRPHRAAVRAAIQPAVAVSAELTPQERLLTQFAAHHPDAALAVARSASPLNLPISVKPLETKPITLLPLASEPIHIEPLAQAFESSSIKE
jgi:hypothetical protein